jgi:hypothetical protein
LHLWFSTEFPSCFLYFPLLVVLLCWTSLSCVPITCCTCVCGGAM